MTERNRVNLNKLGPPNVKQKPKQQKTGFKFSPLGSLFSILYSMAILYFVKAQSFLRQPSTHLMTLDYCRLVSNHAAFTSCLGTQWLINVAVKINVPFISMYVRLQFIYLANGTFWSKKRKSRPYIMSSLLYLPKIQLEESRQRAINWMQNSGYKLSGKGTKWSKGWNTS